MGERRGRCRVGQVIRRDVDRLHRRDRAALGGGDALLHGPHLRGQRGLVTHRRRHPTQEGRHLRTCLGETEDVVDEEQDIAAAALLVAVAEVLCHGQTRQGHACTCTWRLVHLAKHQRRLALGQLVVVDFAQVPTPGFHGLDECVAVLDHARLDHLAQQVVSFTGALTHAGEHRDAFVALGDVVDELHDEDRLAHTCTTEQPNLSTLGVRLNQVDHLDACEQHVGRGAQIFELRGRLVNAASSFERTVGDAVDGFAHHVEETTLDAFSGRHGDACSCGLHSHATAQPFGRFHRNGTHGVFTDVLLGFEDQLASFTLHHECVENFGKGGSLGKANVNDWADDL